MFTPPGRPPVAEECVTCGNPVVTAFCQYCGERRASDRKYSVSDFVREYLESITSFDGRLFRTVKLLVRKPGELTRQFMRGSRLPYLQPLQCFLLLNLAFFIWAGITHQRVFDTPLTVHVGGQPYSALAKQMLRPRIPPPGEERTAWVARFDAVGTTQARSLVIAMVPMFAVLLGLVTIDRWKKTRAVQHLVYSLHLYAFVFILFSVSAYLISWPIDFVLTRLHVPEGQYGYDEQESLGMVSVLVVYMALSLRRAYDLGRARSWITAILFAPGFYLVLQTYRMMLFFVTLFSM
jgi:hypothetical protein